MNKYARYRCEAGEVRGKDRAGRSGVAIMTHEEVGKHMGITRQRVQQLERVALFKLKRGLREQYQECKEAGLV